VGTFTRNTAGYSSRAGREEGDHSRGWLKNKNKNINKLNCIMHCYTNLIKEVMKYSKIIYTSTAEMRN
jgi:uncharacterized protein